VVRTVPEAGFRSTKDSPLLKLSESKFDVLITVDRTLEREFRRLDPRIGLVVVVDLVSNSLGSFLPIFDRLLQAAETVKPGEVIHVSARHNRV
jgi:hypothetical protein